VEDFATSRPLAVADSVARLAELRRRQGRLDEADQLLERAHGHPLAALGCGHLALDRGDADGAADLAQRGLRNLRQDDRTGRAVWLEVLARARAALGDLAEAVAAAQELKSIAASIGTAPLRASAVDAEGVVAAAAGDHDTARCLFEDAIDVYSQCEAPFETARCQLELASSLRALGRFDAATREARRAMRTLVRLEATAEATRARLLIDDLTAPASSPPRSPAGGAALTTRQLDVLGLVAEGLSDREIASRLVLSEHTVHRHVANILTRFGVPTRAAAVARAKQFDLL
jgi:ATP/maltotriose-dependent transcriptional regulator MalT